MQRQVSETAAIIFAKPVCPFARINSTNTEGTLMKSQPRDIHLNLSVGSNLGQMSAGVTDKLNEYLEQSLICP
jgi:hypothetical protein